MDIDVRKQEIMYSCTHARYLYEVLDTGIRICACKSLDETAVVPEQIMGYTVVEIAPYAFSQHRLEYLEGVWSKEDDPVFGGEDTPLLCGERLKNVILPHTLQKIGNYAFYNCYELESITVSSTITDLGSGMFTGCSKISKINMEIVDDRKSCLKEILAELRQELTVWYHSSFGTAKLVFPEFYEEAVENTPARILFTQTHGCGHRYRYCFAQTEFLFREYDSLFLHAKVQESEKLVLVLVLGRLMYPLGLSMEAEEVYRSYLADHSIYAANMVVRWKDMAILHWMTDGKGITIDQLDSLLEAASSTGYAEAVGYLLSYRYDHFHVKKKQFLL